MPSSPSPSAETFGPLLRVDDIHTYYGDSYVLQGVSLTLHKGQIAAILGRNGMGKTTLIRSLAGLTPPRSGEIVYGGVSLRGRPPYEIAQAGIAMVPQGRRIFRSLSVRENLLLPTSVLARAAARRVGDAQARRWDLDKVLEEFPQLAERIDHAGGLLSGGPFTFDGRYAYLSPEMAGYVGNVLTPRLLASGHEVTVYDLCLYGKETLPLDHPNLTLVEGDIRDTEHLASHLEGIDAVLHLACISNDPSFELDPDLSKSINFDCFEPMVVAAREAGVRRFVYCSSSSVYGSDTPVPFTETAPADRTPGRAFTRSKSWL